MNAEFEISVVSNFVSPKKRPCQTSKGRQTLLRTLFWAAQPAFDASDAEDNFFTSKNPMEKQMNVEDA